ncbi:MAG: hypothetical protein HQ538_02390 [Parcubacteria group bacterium]|nr:hypothetical protein [Parcubacteria group bacterium]
MEKLRIAFMYVAKNADPVKHRQIVPSPEQVEMNIIAVKDFVQAEAVAEELVKEGIKIIELCAGFGHKSVARIVQAVRGNAKIGVVRFDCHPALGGKSGDEFF